MNFHLFESGEQDLIQYTFITPDTLEGALDVIRKSFFVDEKVTIAVELLRDPGAAKELEMLCLRTARDGVSIIAIEKKTKKVIGASFNKLQVKSSNDSVFFEMFASNCKYPSSKALVNFMVDADAVVDLFDLCKINCLLEIMFLAVLPEYRRRGIALKLCQLSIDIAKRLSSGKNVKVPITDETLSLKPVPNAVSAIFTSSLSQKLGEKLNFVLAADISYENFIFEGKTFASRIGPDTPSTKVMYKML